MFRILKNQRGFTLIELVIIIILIGLLAGVAIPRFVNLREQAIIAAAKANVDGGRAGVTLDFANQQLNIGTYAPPVTCATPPCTVASGSAELNAIHALLEGVPNYPASGPYDTPVGVGFRWRIMNTPNANTPPRIKGMIDTTCPEATSPPAAWTHAANDDCDVDDL